jgi:hypothetical protein
MRTASVLRGLCLTLAPMVIGACTTEGDPSNFTGGAGGGGGIPGAGGATVSSTGEGGLNLGGTGPGTGGGGGMETCTPGGDDDDVDLDGYTPNTGDCHDCDKNVNPNAVEVPTKEGADVYDEDCDGEMDEVDPPCDSGIAIDEMDAMIALKATELCKVSSGPDDWGVVGAKWVMADGSPPPVGNEVNFHLGHGVLTAFGANIDVRKGERLLAFSSGSARQPEDPGYQNVTGFSKGYQGNHPQGFPKESPACPGSLTGQPNDPTGIEIVIRTPSNAQGFSFDFDFFTYEWPGYVCSTYNDFFVALLTPFPAMQTDGNIAYDKQGNPVSVNNSLLEVCGCDGNPPASCFAGGKTFTCSLGNTDLIGTGFGFDSGGGDHGSTSWLQTKAPVEPASEITVRWAVYDSGDGVLDTTTLVDNWKWIAEPGTTVGTDPVPK